MNAGHLPAQFKVGRTLHNAEWGGRASAHPGGIVDLHLCQQLPVDAEVAETASLIVDDAVALAGHRDEPWTLIVVRALQGPQEVPCDGVDQTRPL